MLDYATSNDARKHLRDVLDAARDGLPTTISRKDTRAAVVDAERLRRSLGTLTRYRVELVAEADGWSAFIPGVPVAADGATVDEAVTEMIEALREYAADWSDRLRTAPNHEGNWALVQLIALSDDADLAEWIAGSGGR